MTKALVPSLTQWRALEQVAERNDHGRLAIACGKGLTTSAVVSNGWVRFVQGTDNHIMPTSGGCIDSPRTSGWLITDEGRAALARARKKHRSDRPTTAQNLAPLRRVVSEGINEHGVDTETLECGHTIHRKKDIAGPTNAYRRRCRHCRNKGA